MHQKDMILPDWLFYESDENLKNNPKRFLNPNFKKNRKREYSKKSWSTKKEVAKKNDKPIIFYCDSIENWIVSAIYLESDIRHGNRIVKQRAEKDARLINEHQFNYQTVLSTRFDKQDETDQVLDEIEL